MNKSYTIVAVILFAVSISAFGQTPEKIEQELVQHIKNINDWAMRTNRTGEDLSEKLAREQQTFRNKLLKITKRRSTLKFEFTKLVKYIHIATSPDRKFRIYSWDTRSGGTMHFFDNVYQYLGKNGKIYSRSNEEKGNAGAFYTKVFQLNTRHGRIYLARSQSVLSTSYNGQAISLFKIRNKSLDGNIKLIKTASGLTNSISFAYDFFSVVDRKERPVILFYFDRKSGTIRFPVVVENKKYRHGKVTNRWIKYRFNGRYFVKVKR